MLDYQTDQTIRPFQITPHNTSREPRPPKRYSNCVLVVVVANIGLFLLGMPTLIQDLQEGLSLRQCSTSLQKRRCCSLFLTQIVR